ncbi:MAG: NADH-quinone oxidoreductase subunit C [Anaerolineae bacterium]|nr:NADH-quinone oxidoreductase subunit C [Anaerolineae bacterium]
MEVNPATPAFNLPDGLVSSTVAFREEVTLHTPREQLLALLSHLKNDQQFNMLTDITCTDYLPKEPRFGMVYQLYSTARNIRVRVKVMLSEFDPKSAERLRRVCERQLAGARGV